MLLQGAPTVQALDDAVDLASPFGCRVREAGLFVELLPDLELIETGPLKCEGEPEERVMPCAARSKATCLDGPLDQDLLPTREGLRLVGPKLLAQSLETA